MKQLLLVLLRGLTLFKVQAQEYKLGLTVGGEYLSISAAKDINNELIVSLPFSAETINSFPPNYFYGGYILVPITAGFAIGPGYQFHTTGSRIGQKDYSGSYSFDQIISAHSFGLQTELQLLTIQKTNMFFELTGGINLSTWKLDSKLIIDSQKEEEILEYSAIKPFVYPALKLKYPLTNKTSISAKAGYCIDLGGKYKLSSNKNFVSETKIVWNGIRASVNFEFGF